MEIYSNSKRIKFDMRKYLLLFLAFIVIVVALYPWYTIMFEGVNLLEVERQWWVVDLVCAMIVGSIVNEMD